ncbi:MAG: ATPase family associated with various cellular activities (AAA) [Syntrophaceae bacterium PtaB.Bin095]|jgi:DNA transposition AAA+ family ATPase|nr:MAG: ATPase family associated with various cellular activities (AAA) [Syntrophaceae bacterium PtaB.Bin095]
MKYELAKTKNVRRFISAVSELRNRPMGVEGMGLLWGEPGEGKTTIVAYAANTMDGIFLRANACWTVTAMLGGLITELGGLPRKRRADMLNDIAERLMDQERVIFVDEADYLFRQKEMLDSLRDIYDLTGTPVILIGMEDIARTIQDSGRFARRITQWIEFKGVDLDDARTLAEAVCEVGVSDDLLAYLHREAKANIGRMVVGLSRIERLAKTNGLTTVTRDEWGDRPLYFDQPKFRKRG